MVKVTIPAKQHRSTDPITEEVTHESGTDLNVSQAGVLFVRKQSAPLAKLSAISRATTSCMRSSAEVSTCILRVPSQLAAY